jgi:hypothetical protein
MTTAQHKAQTLARIGDTTYHIQQAAAEGLVLRGERAAWQENALERAGELALSGFYTESRKIAEAARKA